jgi:hypothetical protein
MTSLPEGTQTSQPTFSVQSHILSVPKKSVPKKAMAQLLREQLILEEATRVANQLEQQHARCQLAHEHARQQLCDLHAQVLASSPKSDGSNPQ